MAMASSNRLRAGALTLIGTTASTAAFMGPATSIYFNTAPGVAAAGAAFPFSMLVAMAAMILMAVSIGAFARKLPTSGFAYTYTVKGFGSRGGFVSGWLLLGSYAMVAPMLLSGMSALLSSFLATFGVNVPWWILALAFFILALIVISLGINRSVQTALIFLVFELAIMLALFVTIIARGGADGNTLAVFNPGLSPTGLSGIGIGALWGILMFVGFESAGTLGEEARAPRITVPRALLTAVLAIGFVYLLSAYTGDVGFGITHAKAFMGAAAPWSTLAFRFWGPALGKLVMVAALSSIFANLISGSNSVVRVMYNMGREGVIHPSLGTTRDGIPVRAGVYYLTGSILMSLILGAVWGPLTVYGFAGTILGLGIIVVYILVNVSLTVYYRKEYPNEVSPWRHGVVPIVASLLMLLPLYGQLVPYPAAPYAYAPIALALWVIGGAIYAGRLRRQHGAAFEELGRILADI